ncbi:uncharacterized protein LOC132636254 isoform X2 [Lycium barbarum]|uniref:uncharacterized protein LOC132636254 isoform X2 n=1 Tax=Lycium barbarum TaxID=112863 RepID=UPI00293F1E48|nr:uncharacterized protein LOC132636254 isoform X2 [Lycium barbarum]
MPKTKCWQNFQKPVQSLPTSQGVVQPTLPVKANVQPTPSIQATRRSQSMKSVQSLSTSQSVAQPTLPVQANTQPTLSIQATRRSFEATSKLVPSIQATGRSVQAASQSASSNLAASQSISSNQAASQPAPFRKRVGRVSNTHWTVDAIDSDKNRKTLRLTIKEVLNLSSEDYIVLDFDYLDAPFGEAQALLAGFCGILVADSSLFPMHFEKWSDLPISYFDRVFDQIMKTTESVARKYVYDSILKKWSANRLDIWEAFRDPLKSKAQIMDNVPPGIPRDQWTSYCYYCFKEETKEMCKRNAENRKKQTIPHTGGSKVNSRRRAEMLAETGQMPGRAQIYLATHKNENGAYVNEAAKDICEKIQITLSQSTVDESVVSPDDAVGKVLGKEHSGRVRCLGLGAVPSRGFKQTRSRFGGMSSSRSEGSCSSHCQENYNILLNAHKEMVNNHNQVMNALKTYMIMKEGMLPEQFAGLFPSPTTPSDAVSASRSPMDARRSYGVSNRSDNP